MVHQCASYVMPNSQQIHTVSEIISYRAQTTRTIARSLLSSSSRCKTIIEYVTLPIFPRKEKN